ncbi:uncharacterized protein SAPINGB_P004713 [Magnusiomyces paraingens]|uniref:Sugar phosphate transporter domain-containing protein n=1 Tax=Magnusiomyces paraingens TaxID=2606893 RepID=A0A5E8BVP4_9ASCO|nr:uncharacterized protein SAPINGB_P004713 [Saprochaete ingens]VVT55738.1 unnamed protein product [Saprochaete ingens]
MSSNPLSSSSSSSQGILPQFKPKDNIAQPLPVSKQYAWLAIYFFFNLVLTLFNKVVLGKFPFPYLLTAVHALAGSIGCFVLHRLKFFTLSRLTSSENMVLVLFSFLYTINIAISNVSLGLVTVPFHQIVRATTPLFAIALNIVFYHSTYPLLTYLSLLLVVAGVGFSTYGDYYSTPLGFFLTLLGAFLAAVKTVVTNKVQTGRLKLSPLELLYRMSPLAFIQTVIYGYFTGEVTTIYYAALEALGKSNQSNIFARAADPLISVNSPFVIDKPLLIKLALNGLIAFGLNVVSFTANKNTNALTMTVAGNVKQVMTIVLAILFFNLEINMTNAFGIFLTLAGGAWYAKIELERKQTTRSSPSSGNINSGKKESTISEKPSLYK